MLVGSFLFSVLSLAALEVANAQTPPRATTDLRLATGESIATATFSQAPQEVLISITFRNRTALVGTHAIRIHSVGQCDPPSFASAGPSVRDLPNLVIGPAGVAVYNLSAPEATLDSLLGRSVVVYAQAGNDPSHPDGGAGARIACGSIGSPAAQAADKLDLLTALVITVLGGLLISGGVLLRRGT
jgi:Cu-Zn family superoxide dismutase